MQRVVVVIEGLSIPDIYMSIKRWPRGFRVAVAWSATLLICLIIMPLFIGVGGYFLGTAACSQSSSVVSAMCSPPGRLGAIFALFSAAILFHTFAAFNPSDLDGRQAASGATSDYCPTARRAAELCIESGREFVAWPSSSDRPNRGI